MALYHLAAKTAAALRRQGKPDPLDATVEITPALLVGLGVSEAVQETAVARFCLWGIRAVYESGDAAQAPPLVDASPTKSRKARVHGKPDSW